MNKLQLINLVSNQDGFLEDKWPLPLSLLWVGTYIQQFGYNVEILDTNILSLDEVIRRIDAEIVGINFYATSAYLLEHLTLAAKEKGATIIVGGQAATPLAKQLLNKNRNIDAVVYGDGEKAMLELVKRVEKGNYSFVGITNVAYRERGDVVFDSKEQVNLCSLPIPDRRLKGIDMEQYIANFVRTNTDSYTENIRPTNVYMKKGCSRRVDNKGCSFCARIDQGLREKTALQAYDEYKYLIEDFNINYIYDDSDSWIRKPWMKSLLALYSERGKLDAKLRVYADVRDINKENVAIMKELGVDAVLVGIESGDEQILRWNGKPITNKMVIEMAKVLGGAGIKLCDAYVLGLIGESKKSIERTISLSRQIGNFCEKQITYWNTIMPLPGSQLWNSMMKIPSLHEKYGNEYSFDIEDVRKDYINYFCNLGKDGCQYLMNKCNYLQLAQNLPARNYVR